jgi:hypothetical protein
MSVDATREPAFLRSDFRRNSRYDSARVELYNHRERFYGKIYGEIDSVRSDNPRGDWCPFACVGGVRIDWQMAFPRFIAESRCQIGLYASSRRESGTWNPTSELSPGHELHWVFASWSVTVQRTINSTPDNSVAATRNPESQRRRRTCHAATCKSSNVT